MTLPSTATGGGAPVGPGVMTKPTGVSDTVWAAAQKAYASLLPARPSTAPSASSS